MRNITSAFIILCLFTGCHDPGPDFPEGEVIGYQPLYESDVDLTIAMMPARAPGTTGKIFLQGEILLLTEVNEGVHFIDNSDPNNPVNLAFLAVSGSSDMSVRDNLLYVNQFNDIVAIDFSDLGNVREVAREADAFSLSEANALVPSQQGYYFECVDPSRGRVIDWRLTTIANPKCYR